MIRRNPCRRGSNSMAVQVHQPGERGRDPAECRAQDPRRPSVPAHARRRVERRKQGFSPVAGTGQPLLKSKQRIQLSFFPDRIERAFSRLVFPALLDEFLFRHARGSHPHRAVPCRADSIRHAHNADTAGNTGLRAAHVFPVHITPPCTERITERNDPLRPIRDPKQGLDPHGTAAHPDRIRLPDFPPELTKPLIQDRVRTQGRHPARIDLDAPFLQESLELLESRIGRRP